MSSSIRSQTISGYVEELANSSGKSVIYTIQTAIVKEFIKSKKEQEERKRE